MRASILIATFSIACLSSCTGASSNTTNASGSADAGANILSQDECDRQADNGITPGNCDAEFDKLVREIDADQDSGG